MATTSPTRPMNLRKSSRLPGGFEDEEDELEIPGEDSNAAQAEPTYDRSEIPAISHESSGLPQADEAHVHPENESNTLLHEEEMDKRLLDVESSDLPEISHIDNQRNGDVDNTYMFGVPNPELQHSPTRAPASTEAVLEVKQTALEEHKQQQEEALHYPPQSQPDFGFRSPKTPPETYQTPAPHTQNHHPINHQNPNQILDTPEAPNTSALETLSSSPTTAAAARTVSRVISQASLGGYETADEHGSPQSPTKHKSTGTFRDPDLTPRKHQGESSLIQQSASEESLIETIRPSETEDTPDRVSTKRTLRPKYLQSRQSTQRMSASSVVSVNTDATSDATFSADYALQTGGATPGAGLSRKSKKSLTRAPSLGSMASGLSMLSDDELFPSKKNFATSDLTPLAEEDRPKSNHKGTDGSEVPSTPKATSTNLELPPDAVTTNPTHGLEVPGNVAKPYHRQIRPSTSPDKDSMAGTPAIIKAIGKGMTLKEHRNTVDRLGKENFDLKMKIHFLDQALQRRSEDGIKEVITENVQLKSDRLRLEKDNHGLRKNVRELEKKLKDRESGETSTEKETEDQERLADAEDEILWLKEQVESYETEVRKMRSDAIERESDKRKLAEMVKSLSETRPAAKSDIGSREEREMWKDMLEAETAAREQADDENRKLKDEIERLRAEASGIKRNGSTKRSRFSAATSQAGSTFGDRDFNTRDNVSGSTLMELDRLKHENSELQKVISAQTSTLTSRNKEKDRLYQEIEDLKMGQRRPDGRSITGDSIFERSASRARSFSRVSDKTRTSRLSSNEREAFETKNGELRDQVSQLKLENQSLKNQFDELSADFSALDRQAQADVDTLSEEIELLAVERDNALRDAEQQADNLTKLKDDYQEEIDNLGDELDERADQVKKLQAVLRNQENDFKTLQNELRSATEGINRLEEDSQSNFKRYKAVQAELEDSNKDLEALEKTLAEANTKIQRLTVQQESSHNEIAFLREEQDADKIKIGDLEAALKTTSMSLQSEKERSHGLERQLAEERHQREVVGSKEKQEVQRIMNDLNRQLSSAQDDIRRLNKVVSARDIELSSWKDKLTEFEHSLRELFGDPQATRATIITSIQTLQKDFDKLTMKLEDTRAKLDMKEQTLADRERLLENTGLEIRKLTDMIERERQGRRADKHSFEQSLKSHQQASRSISQSNTRIAELEAARQADRKKFNQTETQYKDQLTERNSILLQLWKKLSTLCGPDWAHSNSLINGNLPSQEVIGNVLFWPGFSRNLLLAAKQVEGTIGIYKDRIKRTERELWKEYQGLEHTLDVRGKKIDRIEEAVSTISAQSSPNKQEPPSSTEVSKLKGENRLLKAELSLMQQQHRGPSGTTSGGIPPRGSSTRGSGGASNTPAMMASTLMRHHSSNVVEHLASAESSEQQPARSNSVSSRASGRDGGLIIPAYNANETQQAGQDKWIHRLRELERRLKAEREARLLDRSGARKRLEERDAVNEELRMELERERMRRETSIVTSDKPTGA